MLNKVMFFLPSLGGGGAERTVIQLANSFAEQGLNIHLGVCDVTGDKAKLLPEVSAKIQLVNFNCGRVMNSITPLKMKLKAEQYDCLVATQTHTNIVAGIAKKLAGVQTALIFREVSTPSKNLKLQGIAKFVLKTLVNWTYPMAQQVVCVSKGVETDFREYYGYKNNNLSTIYNPVLDDAYFEKLKAPVTHRFFDDHNKVILAVGRLTEAKNFGFLIRSFKALHDQHSETRLIILGEGELRTEFEALVSDLGLNDVVDLPGFDANPYAYFKYASLFVLSSNWEGLPGVLIQALASKVKVVSTDCPSGPMEILENSKFGLLVECNDQAGLTQAMQQAIFADYVDYSEADFEAHIQQFHKVTVLRQYLNMMESAT
ncbi:MULTISPECIES: glycosyltransferase [Acinetobacter]|uniref:glycosyltransferase n=1 Tax=Acinetobacter TaxID=469 RepID=UPI000EA1789F|nr:MULTISPECIES: glycosyltransferase [Acinetobacter]RKG42769.1 glycosyltransferase [Acinetobacter cumulans]RZG58622.1 glycosyltransferase [Acinetobacter sp. WCHAc060006]